VLEGVERSVACSWVGLPSQTKRAQCPRDDQHRQDDKTIIMIGPKIMPYQGAVEPSHQPYIMALLLAGRTVEDVKLDPDRHYPLIASNVRSKDPGAAAPVRNFEIEEVK